MGVKRQWKIQKLTALPIAENVRNELITDIMRRKKPSIRVYAWNVHEGVAEKAFFQQQAAIYDWYTQKKLWEAEDMPKGVLLYEWRVSVDEMLKCYKQEMILNLPVSQETEINVGISPSDLHEDMQRILEKRSQKKQD